MYGAFGSATNPLVAFDVVNEVVSDSGEFADGLRRSPWYSILGEYFIDLAFPYADEAFNDEYAAAGADRPVTLFINDYNTEQAGKRQRCTASSSACSSRGVPVDGVGPPVPRVAWPRRSTASTMRSTRSRTCRSTQASPSST